MTYSPDSFAGLMALLGLLAVGVRLSLANTACTPTELASQHDDSLTSVVFSYHILVFLVLVIFKHIGVSENRFDVDRLSLAEAALKLHAKTGSVCIG